MPYHPAKITTAILHLLFDDVSHDLYNDNILSHLKHEQTIRVVERIKNSVYSGKCYDGEYVPGKPRTQEVIIKVAVPTSDPDVDSLEEVKNLEREHALYWGLSSLQGTVLPKCFGIFRAYGLDGQITISCLVLEKCIPSEVYDEDEFNRQLMVAVCKLHIEGIIHKGLKSASHILRHGTSPRIVDLSKAELHICQNCHPADHLGTIKNEFGSCWELAELEKRLWNNGLEFEEMPVSYISKIVEVGSSYLNRSLEVIMRN